jgi:hypothetical protein
MSEFSKFHELFLLQFKIFLHISIQMKIWSLVLLFQILKFTTKKFMI